MKIKKADIILMLVILAASGLCYLYVAAKPTGSTVCVYSEGIFYGEYALQQNQEIEIITAQKHKNTISISDGTVWVSQADCPDHICMRQGKIARSGASIICIPNRLSITITGANALDAVVY